MLNQLDLTFHSLSDPARREILERLAKGPASVSELARPLKMSMPAVLQHLAVLGQAGLVRSEKVGRTRTCRLEGEALGEARAWIDQRRAEWEGRLDRLGAYLAEIQEKGDGHE